MALHVNTDPGAVLRGLINQPGGVAGVITGVVQTEAYGTALDGSVDVTSKIQDAIDDLPATGGRLIFSAGTYRIDGTLTVNKPVIFEGHGHGFMYQSGNSPGDGYYTPGGTVLRANRTTGDFITLNHAGVVLLDLAIVNAATGIPTSGHGVLVNEASAFHMERCVVQNFYNLIHFVNGYMWTINASYLLDPANIGIWNEDQEFPDGGDSCITNSWITSFARTDLSPQKAIYMTSGGGLKIIGCKVNAAPGYVSEFNRGIDIEMASGSSTVCVLVESSSIENCTGATINLGSGGGSISQIIIKGNHITGFGSGLVVDGAGLSYVSVEGNHITGSLVNGIIIGQADKVYIGTNTITGCAGDEIKLNNTADATNVTIARQNVEEDAVIENLAISSAAITNVAPPKIDWNYETSLQTVTGTDAHVMFRLTPTNWGTGIVTFRARGNISGTGEFFIQMVRAYSYTSSGNVSVSTVGTDVSVGSGAAHITGAVSVSAVAGEIQFSLQKDTSNAVTGTTHMIADGQLSKLKLGS